MRLQAVVELYIIAPAAITGDTTSDWILISCQLQLYSRCILLLWGGNMYSWVDTLIDVPVQDHDIFSPCTLFV